MSKNHATLVNQILNTRASHKLLCILHFIHGTSTLAHYRFLEKTLGRKTIYFS